MTIEVDNILKEFLTQLSDEIKANIKPASGKTASQIKVIINSSAQGVKGDIEAPAYIYTLEDGRPPTKNGNKGGQTLQQSILQWIKTRSFSFPLAPKNSTSKAIKDAESLSWEIAIKIHNEGNLLFRNGGKSGVLSRVITPQRVDAFVKAFGDKSSRILLNQVYKKITSR